MRAERLPQPEGEDCIVMDVPNEKIQSCELVSQEPIKKEGWSRSKEQ